MELDRAIELLESLSADRTLRASDRMAIHTMLARVEWLRNKVKRLSDLLSSLTEWPEGLPLLTEDQLAAVKAALGDAADDEAADAAGGGHGD